MFIQSVPYIYIYRERERERDVYLKNQHMFRKMPPWKKRIVD